MQPTIEDNENPITNNEDNNNAEGVDSNNNNTSVRSRNNNDNATSKTSFSPLPFHFTSSPFMNYGPTSPTANNTNNNNHNNNNYNQQLQEQTLLSKAILFLQRLGSTIGITKKNGGNSNATATSLSFNSMMFLFLLVMCFSGLLIIFTFYASSPISSADVLLNHHQVVLTDHTDAVMTMLQKYVSTDGSSPLGSGLFSEDKLDKGAKILAKFLLEEANQNKKNILQRFMSKIGKSQNDKLTLEQEIQEIPDDELEEFGLTKLDLLYSPVASTLVHLMKRMRKWKEENINQLKNLVLKDSLTKGGRDLHDLGIAKYVNLSMNHQGSPVFSKFRYHNSYIFEPTEEKPMDLSQASWMLENVCMNYKGEFIFYADPDVSQLSTELLSMIYNSTDKYIANIQAWKKGSRGFFKLKIENGHVPTSTSISGLSTRKQQYNTNLPWIEKPTLLQLRYASGNTGHFLADNLGPMFELMEKFSLDPSDVNVLFLDEVFYRPCKPDPTDEFDFPLCVEYMASFLYNKTQTVVNSLMWTTMLTKNQILQRCSYKVFQEKDIDAIPEQDIITKEVKLRKKKKDGEENEDDDEEDNSRTEEAYTTIIRPDGRQMVDSKQLLYRVETGPCPLDDKFSKNHKRRTQMVEATPDFIEKMGDTVQMCFKKVILGVGDRAMVPYREFTKMRELTLKGVRNIIYSNFGIRTAKTKNDPIIVALHDKPASGRHANAIFNLKDIVDMLKAKLNKENRIIMYGYGEGLDKQIQIVPVKLEKLNFIEQVELFSKADVYISTIGSGSFYSTFMPDDSFLLYSPECYKPRIDGVLQKDTFCTQPIIHYHTTLSHLSVKDLKVAVKDCKFRDKGDGKYKDPLKEACDLLLDVDIVYKEVLHSVLSRLRRLYGF